MNENNNELLSGDGNSSEAQRRAERIRAIKNSIRNAPAETSAEQISSGAVGEEMPQQTAFTEETAEEAVIEESVAEETVESEAMPERNEWEAELAERIARRVQKVKSDKAAVAAGIIPAEAVQEPEEPEAESEAVYQEDDSYDDEAEVQEETAEIAEAEKMPEEKPKAVKKNKKKSKKKKQKKTVKESLLGLLPQRNDSIGERIRKVVFLGSCTAIIVCGYIVADYYIDNARTQKANEEFIPDDYPAAVEQVTEAPTNAEGEIYYSMLPSAEKMLEKNEDVVGVINIPGTDVFYPVLQAEDNEKYLDKNIMGEDAKAGALFLDYRNRFDYIIEGRRIEQNSDNQIIYGHNMGSGMMFGTLKEYRNNANYYEEHPIIELNSNYACYKYKIFAFFIIDANDTTETAFDCWNNINFNTEEEFYDFVNEVKRRTIRITDVDVEYGDKLLTLSTCNSIFGQGGGGRLIVMARLVRDGEDLEEGTKNSVPNTNIKWPTLYYKYNKSEKYDPDAEFVPYNAAAETESDAEEATDNTEE